MSRLTDLIAHTKAKDPQLGADLEREVKVLSSRLPFGLNFERPITRLFGRFEDYFRVGGGMLVTGNNRLD